MEMSKKCWRPTLVVLATAPAAEGTHSSPRFPLNRARRHRNPWSPARGLSRGRPRLDSARCRAVYTCGGCEICHEPGRSIGQSHYAGLPLGPDRPEVVQAPRVRERSSNGAFSFGGVRGRLGTARQTGPIVAILTRLAVVAIFPKAEKRTHAGRF